MDSVLPASARFDVLDDLNPTWNDTERGHRITVRREQLISPHAKIFAMGSCFAVEIRRALRTAGCDVYPKYTDMPFDPAVHSPGKLPDRDNINHYDTFVIRQEIERAITRQPVDPASFWRISNARLVRRKRWAQIWQNPLHRHVYASSRDELVTLSQRLNDCIDDGLAAADVMIVTLGLTECWRSRTTGEHVCLGPASEEDEIASLLEFHASSYVENHDNVRATIDAIWRVWPNKKIVLTVSPVALGRTWTGQDVVVANSSSKAILRAVAAQICHDSPSVIYWPSFEYATSYDAYKADGRHVQPAAVEAIVSAFIAAYLTD